MLPALIGLVCVVGSTYSGADEPRRLTGLPGKRRGGLRAGEVQSADLTIGDHIRIRRVRGALSRAVPSEVPLNANETLSTWTGEPVPSVVGFAATWYA